MSQRGTGQLSSSESNLSSGIIIREAPQNTETNILRAEHLIRVIDTVGIRNPHVLIVGIGINAGSILCPYEPYLVAGHLEGTGNLGYEMTLVEVNPLITQDVYERKFLYLPASRLYPFQQVVKPWSDFLTNTNQQEEVVYSSAPDLVFKQGEGLLSSAPERYLKNGLRRAAVPSTFLSKLRSGEVQIIEGDISKIQLNPQGVDIAEMVNVLYILETSAERMAAVKNVISTIKLGGIFIVSHDAGDINKYMESIGFEKFDELEDVNRSVFRRIK
jgi:hypothetical protein